MMAGEKTRGDQLTLELTDMAHGGEAIGRHEGRVVFVPYAIAGEKVRVEIVQDRGSFARARLMEVITPSTARANPPCPHFGRCGGCHWQHIAYPAQLDFKRQVLAGQLRRIASLQDVEVLPTMAAADPWAYRNHVQFHATEEGRLGFMATRSHDVVPVERCLIMHPLLQDLFDIMELELPGLRRFSLRAGIRTGERMIVFEMADDQPPEVEVNLPVSCTLLLSDGTPVTLLGSSHIHEILLERLYQLSATSFFQVNTLQAEQLVQHVCSHVPAGVDELVDAYCGVGTFSVALAPKAGHIVGIESSIAALGDARVNISGMGNIDLLDGSVEDILPSLSSHAAVVVLDPPREGLAPRVTASLLQLAPKRIIYVSCDPATLARDLKDLLTGGYVLVSVQPVDMFPQTYHLETVVILDLQ
jgi:23S rRNA (uracil1939-C5)-methyltransferase